MASLIPGYEYDIFISYRQKDNKHDGWVTEFVNNLKGELESTFKEEISVYFDINPHDGLLETHDVDASLKEKLKCLVFIPIISQTYCDSKSFAWEHEFKAFVELASIDHFGLKIKLPNGNVANRVLPIRIHDLDVADIKLCESVTRGFLRGIEFIYREPGVNKPLTSDDDDKRNVNNTKYRIQINKVANAIKEIISGLKTDPGDPGREKIQQAEPLEKAWKEKIGELRVKPAGLSKSKLLIGVFILIAVIVAAVFAYPKIFLRDTLEKLRSSGERISVAVMPFQNMTNDTTKNFWRVMVQDILINKLTNSEELEVRQSQTMNDYFQSKGLSNYGSITPSVAKSISQNLNANVFIYGSIIKEGDYIRINAKLIDSKTEEAYRAFEKDGTADKIVPTIDSLSDLIKNFLIISKLGKELSPDLRPYTSSNSLEAYRDFIYGNNAFLKKDFPTAVKFLSQAMNLDSSFVMAGLQLAFAYSYTGNFIQAKKESQRLYKKRELMPRIMQVVTEWSYAYFFENHYEVLKYIKQLYEMDNQSPGILYNLGTTYIELSQFNNAITELTKVLEIYNKWGVRPMWVYCYTDLGTVYQKTGQYDKEKELYKKAELDFPDDPDIIYNQAVLALSERDTITANKYFEKYTSILKETSASEASIASDVASIYSEAGVLDKAEKYYRLALSLEPEKPGRISTLAYFLIDKEVNINEGMNLINKALELRPESYGYLHVKGWGLFKQGKYKEAVEILQKSWDLRMKNNIYFHPAYLHLEAAKKAVAGQK